MHVASVMLFEGDPPPYDELLAAHRAPAAPGAALPPEARVRAARPGPAALGRRPAPEPALPRPLDRPPLPRLRGAAAGRSPSRVLRPAARPRQAAVGDLAGRGRRGRPLRACSPRPTTRWWTAISGVDIVTVLFDTSAEPGGAARSGRALAARARCPSRAQLLGEALRRARHRARRGRPLGARGLPRRRARSPERRPRRRRGRRRDGLGRAEPGARRAPTTSEIGPHRRFTWVRDEPRRRQGDQERARRHRQRRRARHGRRRARAATCAGAARRPTGCELKAMVPVSVRGDDERGAARQQGGGDDGAAAGLVPGARSRASTSCASR